MSSYLFIPQMPPKARAEPRWNPYAGIQSLRAMWWQGLSTRAITCCVLACRAWGSWSGSGGLLIGHSAVGSRQRWLWLHHCPKCSSCVTDLKVSEWNASYFLFKITFDPQYLSWFHTEFWNVFSSSVKNVIEVLIRFQCICKTLWAEQTMQWCWFFESINAGWFLCISLHPLLFLWAIIYDFRCRDLSAFGFFYSEVFFLPPLPPW